MPANLSEIFDQAQHALSLIRRDKLAAHCDIDSCFSGPGYLGALYREHKDKIIETIKLRNHQGRLPARRISTDQAYTQTRDLIAQLYPHTMEKEIARLDDQEWVCAATGIFLDLKDKSEEVRPQNLNLFYMGDFLDCLEACLHLSHHIQQSLRQGDEENTLAVLKRLRAIPDYRDHFPNHPPSQGGKRKPAENSATYGLTGNLQPLRG